MKNLAVCLHMSGRICVSLETSVQISFVHFNIKKKNLQENFNEEEIDDSVEFQQEEKAWCEVCEMEYDDMIDLEIHERRFHETSDEQK